MKSTLTLLLLIWAGIATAQTVTVPTVPEVNRKLDSLARQLRTEFASTDPGQPGIPDCEHKLELKDVYNVSGTGIEYNFYSIGVSALIETAYTESGQKAATHRTDPVLRDRVQVPFSLKPGKYYLIIENANCKAVSERVYFIVPDESSGGIEPEQPGEPVPFFNPGVYKKQVGSILYEWIPSEFVSVEIIDGRVKLIAPETKQSREGNNTCKRFVLGDHYDNRLSDSDASALFGAGLKLPTGQYHFKILYTSAQNWEVLLSNKWHFMGTDGNARQRSGSPETLLISVYDGTNDHERVCWVPQYQLTNQTLKLPEDKIFGVTRYIYDVDRTKLFNQFTHLQWTSDWMDPINKSRLWKNIQALNSAGDLMEPDWVANNSVRNPLYAVMSEATEQYDKSYLPPTGYNKSEEIYRLTYSNIGVSSPNQTWLISDYFTAMYGGSISGGFFGEGANLQERRRGLSDLFHARSERDKQRWSQSRYFTANWIDYRNFLTQGYLTNVSDMAGSWTLFSRIYQHEKAGLAITNRRKVTYVTPQQEHLGFDEISNWGTSYAFPIDGGDLIRHDAFFHSYDTFLCESFYSLLFGNGLIIWDSSNPLSREPINFALSEWGGYADWKTKYRKDGKTSSYADVPNRVRVDGIFPTRPMTSDQGAWVGAKLYESILGRVDRVRWADYSLNGKSVVAKRGATGTAQANVNGLQNFGQDNIVWAHNEVLPIVLVTEGPGGSALVYQNPFAGLAEEQGVEVAGRFFKFVGNKLNVVKL